MQLALITGNNRATAMLSVEIGSEQYKHEEEGISQKVVGWLEESVLPAGVEYEGFYCPPR